MSEKTSATLRDQLASFRRWRRLETIFGAAGVGLFLGTILLFVLGQAKYGFYACLMGFEALIPAAACSMRRKRIQGRLEGLGPVAIGPLAESLYFDITGVARREEEVRIDAQERAQTVTVLLRLLPEAAIGHFRALPDREAHCLYRCLDPTRTQEEAGMQTLILGHLLQSPDTRALDDVIALSDVDATTDQEVAMKEKATHCRQVLWEVAFRERAGEGLLRAAGPGESETLVRPAGPSHEDGQEVLLRPGDGSSL